MTSRLSQFASRFGRPSLADWIFAFLLGLILIAGRNQLFNDPGTAWHYQLGHEILKTRSIPTHDTFTFTRQGAHWINQYWAFDAAFAALVDQFGWTAALLAASVLIAWIYSSLAKGLIDDGRLPLSAVAATILAVMVGSVHFLVRPHLLTIAFVLVTARLCLKQHERGGWRIFWVPVLVAVWANLHGGFLAAPLIVVTAALGHAISGELDRGRRENLAKFAAAALLCIATPLANPQGLELYRHVFHLLLTSGLTPLIQEYQPIPFGKPESRAMEWIILLMVSLPIFRAGRMNRYEWVQTIVWLHLSLATIRHAPLFGIIAAPGLARMFDEAFSREPNEANSAAEKATAWPWAGVALVAAAIVGGWSFGGFDRRVWPLDALPTLREMSVSKPLFHEQDWGGLLECKTNPFLTAGQNDETKPNRRTYLDDRFELFGKSFMLEYIKAIEGEPEWETVRDRETIKLVWVRPDRGLARRLERDPEWRVAYRDAISVLFERMESSRFKGRTPVVTSRAAGDPDPAFGHLLTGGEDMPRSLHSIDLCLGSLPSSLEFAKIVVGGFAPLRIDQSEVGCVPLGDLGIDLIDRDPPDVPEQTSAVAIGVTKVERPRRRVSKLGLEFGQMFSVNGF